MAAAFVCSILAIVFALADASILAGTNLPQFLPAAVAMTLLSAGILALVMSLLSGFQGCIVGAQEISIVILATITGSIARSMPATTVLENQSLIATLVASLILATVAVGLSIWLAGHFKLGKFIRYLPYPVICGFLGGAGLVLTYMALNLVLATHLQWINWQELLTTENLTRIGLAIAVAYGAYQTTKKSSPRVLMPLFLLVAIGLFLLYIGYSDSTIEYWASEQWMLSESSQQTTYPPYSISDLFLIDWWIVAAQLPKIAVLIVITLIGALIKISALEIMLHSEVDQDRELRALGLANLATGFGGGVCGFHTLAQTQVAKKMHASNRMVGIFTALLCFLALFFSGNYLQYMPRFVFAGLLLWISFDLIYSSIMLPLTRLRPHESATLITVVAAVVGLGFMEGVVIGLVAAALLFVIDYSKIDIIRRRYTGTQLHSSVDRNPQASEWLRETGGELLILRLQGYLFFGTSYRLIEEVKQQLESASTTKVRYLLLDLEKVNSIDASGEVILASLLRLSTKYQLHIMISVPQGRVLDRLKAELEHEAVSSTDALVFFTKIDEALEWYEQRQLEACPSRLLQQQNVEFAQWIGETLDAKQLDQLTRYLEPVHLKKGETLYQQFSVTDSIYLLQSGALDIVVPNDSGQSVRIRQIGAGSMVGEVSMYLDQPASATVVASQPSLLMKLTRDRLDEMLTSSPDLAALFHKRMAMLLAHRLTDNSRLIRMLSSS